MRVIILICSILLTEEDCTRETAADFMFLPQRENNLVMCALHGQAYVAGTILVGDGYYVKVLCQYGNHGNIG